MMIIQSQGGLVIPSSMPERRNRGAVGASRHLLPGVAEAATPGWRTQPHCGYAGGGSVGF